MVTWLMALHCGTETGSEWGCSEEGKAAWLLYLRTAGMALLVPIVPVPLIVLYGKHIGP